MRATAGFICLALLSACASAADPEPPASGPAGAAAPRRAPPNTFISPSGEPFRAGPDEPYASALWFRQADTDGDGRLTPAEFMADAERVFRKLDANGDGVIDGFEITAYEETVAPEILPRVGRLRAGEGMDADLFNGRSGGRRRPTGEGGGGGGRVRAADTGYSGADVFGMLAEPEPLKAADADLDGRVSAAEWRARTRRRFQLLDEKAVGALTLERLPKPWVQKERERRLARSQPARPPRPKP